MSRAMSLLVLWTVAAVSGCAIVHEQRLSAGAPHSKQHANVEVDIAVDGRRGSFYSIPPQTPADSESYGTVTVRSDDVRREYAVLSVQSIEIRYTDAAVSPEVRYFEVCETDFVGGLAELPIHSVFTRCGDAHIIVRGTLHASNGDARQFECRQDVVVQSDWHFLTWLDWIASC